VITSNSFLQNGVILTRATTKNLRPLKSLIKDYYNFDGIKFDDTSVTRGLRDLFRNPGWGQAWLLQHRRRFIGYLICTFGFDLEFGGRQATITDFYLRAGYRRKGLGRAAMIRLEEKMRLANVQALELQVTRRNRRTVEFYKRLGFKTHSRIPLSKRIGQAVADNCEPRKLPRLKSPLQN
jgi:ribosomal protein S18 acetylase RimI-like enzyme